MITEGLLSVTNTFKAIRALGMTASRNDGEWRVNYPKGREETAYYTNDNKDAVGTATLMAKDFYLWKGESE